MVFRYGKVISPNRDSKVGKYLIEYKVPPYFLNSGKYQIKLWFGLSQAYLLWGNYYHCFEIENTLTGQGYDRNRIPGILKPHFSINCFYSDSYE